MKLADAVMIGGVVVLGMVLIFKEAKADVYEDMYYQQRKNSSSWNATTNPSMDSLMQSYRDSNAYDQYKHHEALRESKEREQRWNDYNNKGWR